MTNLEYLESLKKFDDNNAPGNLDNRTFYNYRQAKALEIIAETLISLKNDFDEIRVTSGDSIKIRII